MWLVIGDLHLSDKARDSYRFGIFKWIAEQQATREVTATFILGDLTENKDRHSATLVNKIVSGLVSLRPPVYIVKGNHDYTDPKNPFFKFLNHIDGIKFAVKPCVVEAGKRVALIPHYRTQTEFDQAVKQCGSSRPECFFVHQTFDGAIAETGSRLTGLSASPIEFLKPRLGVYAGDVHKPQDSGIVTYVGCPYQVRFGDNYEPRVIWLGSKGQQEDLVFDSPRKWSLTVRCADDIKRNKKLYHSDQVKLIIDLTREEAVEWKSIKQEILTACKKKELEIHGVKIELASGIVKKQIASQGLVQKDDLFTAFCKNEAVTAAVRKFGHKILGEK